MHHLNLHVHAPDLLTAPGTQRQVNKSGCQLPSGKHLISGRVLMGSAFSIQDAVIVIDPKIGAIVIG